MATVALARYAMATRFELVLHGSNPVSLRAAGEEALDEISRLETQLSFYLPNSELAHLNAHASQQPVRVEPRFFQLLQTAQRLSMETNGAFDVTTGPLTRLWSTVRRTGQLPAEKDLAEARERVGMHLVKFEETNCSVCFTHPGVQIDLGAIGKGYALERAVEFLREAGIQSALLHGGTSTTYALGAPPGEPAWNIAIDPPEPSNPKEPLAVIALHNEALSVSAVWGRAIELEGRTYGHVIDPRTGLPAETALLAALVLPSATETDALSTALLTLGAPGLELVTTARPVARALVVSRGTAHFEVAARGITARGL